MTDFGPTTSADFGPIDLDLGDGHGLRYYQWSPDRTLNPQYDGIPDDPKAGALVVHKRADGSACWSGVTFRTDVWRMRRERFPQMPEHPAWDVLSWDPLTLAPSLLCRLCDDHGFIREGRWVRA